MKRNTTEFLLVQYENIVGREMIVACKGGDRVGTGVKGRVGNDGGEDCKGQLGKGTGSVMCGVLCNVWFFCWLAVRPHQIVLRAFRN